MAHLYSFYDEPREIVWDSQNLVPLAQNYLKSLGYEKFTIHDLAHDTRTAQIHICFSISKNTNWLRMRSVLREELLSFSYLDEDAIWE